MFDWSHLQTFVAVAQHGSLSSAARALGGSQPTMGRHVAALESELAVRLFDRTAGGLQLTPTGMELLDYARRMATAATSLELAATSRSTSIQGTIRITASEIVATYVLPDILTELHRSEPEIAIELVATNRTENLLQREADIAIRMYRPSQADVISRKVTELQLGIYASHDYIDRHGAPEKLEDFGRHVVVGYDRSDQIIQGFRAAGLEVDRDFFAFRSDDQVVCWRMVVAGFGIGFNQTQVGDAEPAVQRLLADQDLPTMPIWLTAHAELKTSVRVRRVYDFLARQLAEIH